MLPVFFVIFRMFRLVAKDGLAYELPEVCRRKIKMFFECYSQVTKEAVENVGENEVVLHVAIYLNADPLNLLRHVEISA